MKSHSVSSNILSSPKPPLKLRLSEVVGEGLNRHKGVELVRTAASATKVECCALVCPCPHISKMGRGSEVRGSWGGAQQ